MFFFKVQSCLGPKRQVEWEFPKYKANKPQKILRKQSSANAASNSDLLLWTTVIPQALFSFLTFRCPANSSSFNLPPCLEVFVATCFHTATLLWALLQTHKYPFTQLKENAWRLSALLLPRPRCKLGEWQLLELDLATRSHVPLGAALMSQGWSDQLQMFAAAGWGDVFFVMRDGWGCFPSDLKYPERVFFPSSLQTLRACCNQFYLLGPNSRM